MSSITDNIDAPAKILLIGKSGAGKTGALASLVTQGYNLRIIDTDKGIRPLRSLLTDDHYPYNKIIKAKGIDLSLAVRYITIDTAMKLRTVTQRVGDKMTSQTLLAPSDARAWTKVLDILDKWKDDDLDLGSVRTWGPNDVLVFDSFSTLAKAAYYFSQSLNGRLGARDQGFDYRRDVGEAQSQLTRLLELLYDSSITCNVIVISHVTWVDESQGVASRPQENSESKQVLTSPDGYPSAIGRALSPHMGKYFNDSFIASSDGSGTGVRRTISTVPRDGIMAKNSVYMEREYPVATALAQIFAAIRGTAPPQDLLDATRARPAAPPTAQARVTQPTSATVPA